MFADKAGPGPGDAGAEVPEPGDGEDARSADPNDSGGADAEAVRADGVWVTVAVGNGTTVSVPLMPIVACMVLVCCVRTALPKLSKRLWRRIVSCDL